MELAVGGMGVTVNVCGWLSVIPVDSSPRGVRPVV